MSLPASSTAQQAAPPPASPLRLSQQARRQLNALKLEKMSRTPGQRKMASNLVLAARKAANQPLPTGFPEVNPNVAGPDGKTLVDVNAKVTDALIARIRALGGEVVSSHPRYDAIRARVPVARLESLANEPDVRTIQPAIRPMTNKIDTSEGDIAHRANTARLTYGTDGSGVKVGVLSDSAESLASLLSSGDLPAVTVLPGQEGSGSSEGTAMLEIVHDLAAGASLYFATAFNGPASFAENILALHAAGCQVIVDDVIYFNEPVFQDGIIAQAVETVCAAGGLYFSSAGNSGNKNDGTSGVWEGNFAPGANPAPLADYGTAHEFESGVASNVITADSPSLFTLQWSDPWGQSTNDYDLFLLNSALTTVLDYSNSAQDGAGYPFEAIDSRQYDDTGLCLVVVKYSGEDRYLHLNANRGRLSISTAGQTWGHSAASGAISVAAVAVGTAGGGAFTGGESNPVEYFSSDGPRRVFYLSDGTPITPGDFSSTGGLVRQKPDMAAADGVSTATPGFDPFYGTSAAAPHAAAIAALVWSRQPSLTAAQVRTILTSTALDIEANGVDRDSGAGILDAHSALAMAATASPAVSSVTASNTDGSYRAGSLISIQVIFSAPVIVTGTPQLALNTTPTRTATYASGSGTDTLAFDYAVQEGDASTDLDYASTTALTLNGGTITSAEGVNALLVLPAPGAPGSLGANKGIVIDASSPVVSSISSPSIPATQAGPVTYTISFSEPVVGFDSGNDIQLNTTGTAAAASVSISGFGSGPYTVTLSGIAGDGTLGIAVNAGACTDASGNPNTAGPAGAPLTVDNTPPTVTSISPPSQAGTITGPVSYTVSFSEAVTGFDSGDDVQVDATGTAAASVNLSGSGAGPYTVTLSDLTGAGTLAITIKAGACVDAIGNQNPASATSAAFTVSRYNLRFNQPSGWATGLILSTEQGTSTGSLDETATLYLPPSSQRAYLDFAVENSGASDLMETTSVGIYLDDQLVATRSIDPPFTAGSAREILDVPVELEEGSHVLRLALDHANLVPEADESDNAATLSFSVVQTQVLDNRPPPPVRGICGAGAAESLAMLSLMLACVQWAPALRRRSKCHTGKANATNPGPVPFSPLPRASGPESRRR